jgi:hypothetical protein
VSLSISPQAALGVTHATARAPHTHTMFLVCVTVAVLSQAGAAMMTSVGACGMHSHIAVAAPVASTCTHLITSSASFRCHTVAVVATAKAATAVAHIPI